MSIQIFIPYFTLSFYVFRCWTRAQSKCLLDLNEINIFCVFFFSFVDVPCYLSCELVTVFFIWFFVSNEIVFCSIFCLFSLFFVCLFVWVSQRLNCLNTKYLVVFSQFFFVFFNFIESISQNFGRKPHLIKWAWPNKDDDQRTSNSFSMP